GGRGAGQAGGRGWHRLLGEIELAGTAVLVRVELDFLETDNARHDVDLAVRSNASVVRSIERAIDRGRPIRLEGVDRCDLRVGDRRRVVVAVDLAHEGLSTFEVEALHLVELPLHDVDRL